MTPPPPGGRTTEDGARPGTPAATASVQVDLEVRCQETVEADRWASLLADALAHEGVAAGAAVGLTFVGPDEMAALNRTHMGGDGPTDVLAFPIDGLAAGGGGDGPPGVVGDVVVCPAVAARNAPDHAGRPEDELALLVVHGALHLLGHDHAEPGERERMQDRERALLVRLHGRLAGDPWTQP